MRFPERNLKTRLIAIVSAFSSAWLCGCGNTTDTPVPDNDGKISILTISPVRGIPGDTIVIRGRNFTNEVEVIFGADKAKIIEISESEIQTVVPESVHDNTYVIVSSKSQKSNTLAFHFQILEKLTLADPAVLLHGNTYYVYGTGGKGGNVDRGFQVYSSPDLRKWYGPKGANQGFALTKDNSYGDWGFWAPQVFLYNGQLYMAYTANENIAIAKSNSPLGPFVKHAVLTGPTRQIDPYIYVDDDGKVYIYFVRLSGGNKIYVAEMKEDLSEIRQETAQLCIEATDGWEDTQKINWKVIEGPTVLKHDNAYYLFYSANHFENRDYSVGYAVSESPLGPWVKSNRNPILSRELLGFSGTGHGDFFKDKDNHLRYVFHTHFNNSAVQPRVTAVIGGDFSGSGGSYPVMTFKKETFKFLLQNN